VRSSFTRRLPVGAELQEDGSTHFRVWAPDAREIRLLVEPRHGACLDMPLEPEAGGYHAVHTARAGAGDRYRFRLDGKALADPASRYQPDGPFGVSEIVDPASFAWSDARWRGPTLEGQVLYELHVGTFSPDGTWRGATNCLPNLAHVGITAVEIMPVSEFPGRFGWGYDGVFPYAPTRLYGTPDDFRSFVDRAHDLGLAVILDVVYNHLGPDGCVFKDYAAAYFTTRYENEWGDPLNFDGDDSGPVREFFAANAAYWIDEYHLDGLRLDATQSMHDASSEHVLALIARRARNAAQGRSILLIAENEPQHVRTVRPQPEGGYGLDALWNDDFHHSAVVALTGRREAYYTDHAGAPQEFVSAAKYGYLFQGQRYAWQKQNRGSRTDRVQPAAFVTFLENHDQLANSGGGRRMHARTTPGRHRAATALLLLMPGTPMLFQGQEFGASAPFLYFADHKPELAAAIQKGRAEFVAQFPSLASPEMQARLPAPQDRATFERCKLDWSEFESHRAERRLHEDLLALRRSEPAFRAQTAGGVDGAVLQAETFVLRYLAGSPADERLLVVNLGIDVIASSIPEPLVAPPDGAEWVTQWSSEHPDYGGAGASPLVTPEGWRIPGHSATVLAPRLVHQGLRGAARPEGKAE
jgi:maltooligosyltrehalose trehalohydrolase